MCSHCNIMHIAFENTSARAHLNKIFNKNGDAHSSHHSGKQFIIEEKRLKNGHRKMRRYYLGGIL